MADIEQRQPFRLGDWTVEPQLNRLSRDGHHVEVEPKSVAVLAYMAERPGQVISSDEFIDVVWCGRPMGDNPVHRCVSRLRHALGDDAHNPRYIATVQRKGYRLIADVEALTTDNRPATSQSSAVKQTRFRTVALSGAVIVVLAIAGGVLLRPEHAVPTPSIAVLPFESLTDDIYIAKGISEDIRSGLGAVEGLSVSSRGASTQFPVGTDPKMIGDMLRVSWVLEGTARVNGADIKVTATLIDAATRFETWSESYEGTAADIIDIQDRIATAVVNAVVLTMPSEWRLTTRGTDVISAYDEFLRGQAALERPHDDQNLPAAEQHFTKALEYDPKYARAHAGLCRTYIAWFGFALAADYVDKAETACNAARSLDASLSEVPLALGGLNLSQGKLERAQAAFEDTLKLNANSVDALTGLAQTLSDMGDPVRAETVFVDALAAQPNDWTGYTRFAFFLLKHGRYAEAARMYQRTVDLQTPHTATFNNLGAALYLMGDFEMAAKAYEESLRIRPNRSAHSNLGTQYYYLGKYDDAVDHYRRAIDLKPQDYVMWGNLGDALSRSAMSGTQAASAYEQAIELAARHLEVNPSDGETYAHVGSYLAHLGRFDQAATNVAEAINHAPDEPYVHYYASVVFAIMVRPESAVSELKKAVDLGYPIVLIRFDPEFAPLRGSPHYETLIADTAPGSGLR